MKFLFKFYIRNEQEIRQDLPSRTVFVAAESMVDAVNGYNDLNSLVQSIEFVSPITVVPSKSDLSTSDSNLIFHILFRDNDGSVRDSFVHAPDSSIAITKLSSFLGYTPVIDSSRLIDDLVI